MHFSADFLHASKVFPSVLCSLCLCAQLAHPPVEARETEVIGNTSGTLRLLYREGLLAWHVPAHPAQRFTFLRFGMHYTAVLTKPDNGRNWAVDAWFHANGVPAEVVELERWRQGWRPD